MTTLEEPHGYVWAEKQNAHHCILPKEIFQRIPKQYHPDWVSAKTRREAEDLLAEALKEEDL